MQLKYKLGRNNQLIIVRDKERLRLKGRWDLDKKHNLIFTLAAGGKDQTYRLRRISLKGKWQADKYNRLQFLIKQGQSFSKPLTFKGTWQVKNNSLIYTYRIEGPKTKKKQTKNLRFQGFWEINQKNRLTYILDAKNNSYFEFKTYLETPSIIGKAGTIKYRAGIGVKGSKLFKIETITLYGVWKFQRKTGLSFEMDYGQAQVKAIRFGAFVRISKKNKVSFALRSREGKDLGLSLEFRRTFFKTKAQWFLKILQGKKHPGLKLGFTIPW
jgi:hypothetical protein